MMQAYETNSLYFHLYIKISQKKILQITLKKAFKSQIFTLFSEKVTTFNTLYKISQHFQLSILFEIFITILMTFGELLKKKISI